MPKAPRGDLVILPDEYQPRSRRKRSLLKSHRNGELNVETLVVVDRKMMQNHGHDNITTYVLTILNMVGTGPGCVAAPHGLRVCVQARVFYILLVTYDGCPVHRNISLC